MTPDPFNATGEPALTSSTVTLPGRRRGSHPPPLAEPDLNLFNFERPTAQVHGRDLVVKAFPGADYVHHYALIPS